MPVPKPLIPEGTHIVDPTPNVSALVEAGFVHLGPGPKTHHF